MPLRARELPGLKEIFFDDDTFNYQKARTIELCTKLKPLKFTWSCTSRVTTDYDTLKAMKEAGCRLLIVGYESGDQQILKNIKKGATIDMARRFTANCKKLGLVVHGDFIVGLPGETLQSNAWLCVTRCGFQYLLSSDSQLSPICDRCASAGVHSYRCPGNCLVSPGFRKVRRIMSNSNQYLLKPLVSDGLMDDDKQHLVISSLSFLAALWCLGIQDLIQLKVFAVIDRRALLVLHRVKLGNAAGSSIVFLGPRKIPSVFHDYQHPADEDLVRQLAAEQNWEAAFEELARSLHEALYIAQ